MKEATDKDRRAFVSKVASISIATAFGGLAGLGRAEAQLRRAPTGTRAPTGRLLATESTSSFKILSKGAPPDPTKPEGSVLEEGDLGKLAHVLDEHPDAAIRAVLKQTAEGLASKDAAREQFSRDVHGALRSLNIDMPPDILPDSLQVPAGIRDAATKRKGWGIGSGHSNSNCTTQHRNHRRYSDYSDWW